MAGATAELDRQSFAGPRGFARWMLKNGGIQLRPLYDQIMTFRGQILESVLFREACWQIELVAALPGAVTERHRHLRCESADLLLNGEVVNTVGGRGVGLPSQGKLEAQLRTIGIGEWHGGAAGDRGLVYLSFQRWLDEPTFISQDWQAWTD